jgi:hypothetical protein
MLAKAKGASSGHMLRIRGSIGAEADNRSHRAAPEIWQIFSDLAGVLLRCRSMPGGINSPCESLGCRNQGDDAAAFAA